MEKFGKFCFTMLALLIAILMSGFVFMKLWAWLVVPIFHVMPLTFAQSIGLMTIKSYISSKPSKSEDKLTTEKIIEGIIVGVGYAAFVLGIAWLITLFI